jgi:hypothetical protein
LKNKIETKQLKKLILKKRYAKIMTQIMRPG